MELKHLTPRQYDLRKYLWNHRTEWTSSKDIYKAVPGYASEKTAYKQINSDVKEINESGIYHHIIITDRTKGYKLPTKEEFWEWAGGAYNEAKRKIAYVNNLLKLAKSDGQGILPYLETYDKGFYERFVSEVEGKEAKAKC